MAFLWAKNIAAFVYLGGGIAFTFFGPKFVELLISGLAGLIFAALPVYFLQNLVGVILAVIIFGGVSYYVFHKHDFHAAVLGVAVGSYVGSLIWTMFLSEFTEVYVKYILQLAGAAGGAFLGHSHSDKRGKEETKHKETMLSCFIGGNMIATSIMFWTNDAAGKWGNFGIQLACIFIFMGLGHKFYDWIHGHGKDAHFKKADEERHDAEANTKAC